MASTNVTLLDMFRALPVKSLLFSLGPVVLALAQFLNSYYHDVPIAYAAGFGAMMIVLSVALTQYHFAEFKLRRLQRELFDPSVEQQ